MQPSPQYNFKTFPSFRKNSLSYLQSTPLQPQSQAVIASLSVSIDINFLNISYKWNYKIYYLCVWLFGLGIMLLKFIFVVVVFRSLLPFIAEQNSIVWLYHILFNDSPVDGWLDFFQHFWLIQKMFRGHCFQL